MACAAGLGDISGLGGEHAAAELTPQPGLDDLDQLVEQVRAAGLRVTLARRGTPGGWDPGAGLAVYRIVQEALTNTLKHAGAGPPRECGCATRRPGVDVEVIDDGAAGAATSRAGPRSGHGLAGMGTGGGLRRHV